MSLHPLKPTSAYPRSSATMTRILGRCSAAVRSEVTASSKERTSKAVVRIKSLANCLQNLGLWRLWPNSDDRATERDVRNCSHQFGPHLILLVYPKIHGDMNQNLSRDSNSKPENQAALPQIIRTETGTERHGTLAWRCLKCHDGRLVIHRTIEDFFSDLRTGVMPSSGRPFGSRLIRSPSS